jgi:hypothetical protein
MNEKKKHKIMLGIEVVLLCMIVAILGTNAASSNPPSNGVSYGKNNQTTVEGALNDLYTKANYGNATASQILKGKTALVGGKQVIGTYEAPTLASQTSATAGAGDILSGKTAYVNGSKITGSMEDKGAVNATIAPGETYTILAGYHNGSGKVTASSCPICNMTETSTSSELTYTDGMTLSAKGTYVFCVTAAKYDSKAYATITYTYGSESAVNTVWEYAAKMEVSNNTTNTKCRVVYVKEDTTLTRRVTNNNNGVVRTSIFKVS